MQGLKFGALVLGRKKMGNKRLHLALRPLRLNYTGHHRTAKNREFWVSTGVDFAISVAVGFVAAILIGAVVTGTTPLWLAVGATAFVGIAIGGVIDFFGIPRWLKRMINNLFDGEQE